MAYVIAIANQKGGVGKTTTAVNLSAALSHLGYSVLLIDLDPQGNATSGLGVQKADLAHSANDLFSDDAKPLDLAVSTPDPRLRLVPSNSDLIGVEGRLDELNKHFYLRDSLEDLIERTAPPLIRTSDGVTQGESTREARNPNAGSSTGSQQSIENTQTPPKASETGGLEGSPGGDQSHPESPGAAHPEGTQVQAAVDASPWNSAVTPEKAVSAAPAGDQKGGGVVSSPSENPQQAVERIDSPAEWVPHYVFLDCPPTLNVITTNALVASDSLLIPVQAEFYALEGLTELLRTFTAVRKRFNPGLTIEGMLLTMFDSRTRLAGEVESELRKHYGDRVFRSVIPRSVRFGEAPSHGRTILDYDPTGRGAEAYLSLAKEVTANDSKRAWSRSFVAAARRRSGPVPEPAVPRHRGLSEDFLRRD